MPNLIDIDPIETQEWLNAFRNVLEKDGRERAQFLLKHLSKKVDYVAETQRRSRSNDYVNTILSREEPVYPGNLELEARLDAIIQWNAAAMVIGATRFDSSLGGHLATYASYANLFQVGFLHHFRATNTEQEGDLIYFQGHSAPGFYARAYLEGRITELELKNFRQEAGKKGLSSYPHPRTMPHFWQFPTVSMGLGPLQAIYQAQFLKFLQDRGLAKTEHRKVWAFCGDGEMDEPESLGAINIASYNNLDNLIFVINCNLQRLDGPVRGNGSIVRELEGLFEGSGWNVIKVLWGSGWDPLLDQDQSGLLIQRFNECLDGEYQRFSSKDGAFIREEFFGKYPELKKLVTDWSDEDIWNLKRGGHDSKKIHAAYLRAQQGQNRKPTVILAQTVKGYGLASIAAKNTAHNIKKMDDEELKQLRDGLNIPIEDKDLASVPFYKPPLQSEIMQYLFETRQRLSGFIPARRSQSEKLPVPEFKAFETVLKSIEGREMSSNMALIRIISLLFKDKILKERLVLHIPDEARTLGLEGLFRQVGIYSSLGQLYTPVDDDQLIAYKESKRGQILQAGINEAGAFSSWIASSTSYSTNNLPMIPFYFYYSMFGFQRIGDLAWAAGDMRSRGFLIGGLAGRTTLAGEGLQHDDGHSHILASTIPCCRSYDPSFAYELAVIVQEGLKRMLHDQEDVYYYITVMNENYIHPPMPARAGTEEGIIKGLYLFKPASTHDTKQQVQLIGSGAILREIIKAAEMLEKDFGVYADIWSATSFNELRREGLAIERWNLLNPGAPQKTPYVTACLMNQAGPVIIATDYMKIYADQIRAFLPEKQMIALGTDGFGISDTRTVLRDYFEIDARYISLAALTALVKEGHIPASKLTEAIKKYQIDINKINPMDL